MSPRASPPSPLLQTLERPIYLPPLWTDRTSLPQAPIPPAAVAPERHRVQRLLKSRQCFRALLRISSLGIQITYDECAIALLSQEGSTTEGRTRGGSQNTTLQSAALERHRRLALILKGE